MRNRSSETSLDTISVRLLRCDSTKHLRLPKLLGEIPGSWASDQEMFCVSVHLAVNGESHALPQLSPKLLNAVS